MLPTVITKTDTAAAPQYGDVKYSSPGWSPKNDISSFGLPMKDTTTVSTNWICFR